MILAVSEISKLMFRPEVGPTGYCVSDILFQRKLQARECFGSACILSKTSFHMAYHDVDRTSSHQTHRLRADIPYTDSQV